MLSFSLSASTSAHNEDLHEKKDKQVIRLASDWLQIGFRKSSDQIGTGGTENSLCPSIFKSVTPALKEEGAVISRLFHWTESWMLILRRNHRRAVSPSVRLLLNTREVGIIETRPFKSVSMMSEATAPPRKRRRSALSCVECRRRKINCDRRMPCSHCMQLKSMICTYPETHSDVANRRNVDSVLQGAQVLGTSSPLPNFHVWPSFQNWEMAHIARKDLGAPLLSVSRMTVPLRRMFKSSSTALGNLRNHRHQQCLPTRILIK